MQLWRRLRAFVGFAIAATLQIWVVLEVAEGADRLVDDSRAVAQSQSILEAVRSAYAEVRDVEASQRGFLLTGSEDLLVEFYSAQANVGPRLQRLSEAIGDDVEQAHRVELIGRLAFERVRLLDGIAAIGRTQGLQAAQAQLVLSDGAPLMERIAQLVYEIETSERERLDQRRERSREAAKRLRAVAAGGIATSLSVLALVFVLLAAENRERRRAQAAEAQARDRLEAGLRSLQRASHELRELSRFAGALQRCRSQEEAIALSRDALATLLPELGGSIYLAAGDEFHRQARFGRPIAASADVIARSECQALESGANHLTLTLAGQDRCAHFEPPPAGLAVASLCIPLSARDRQLGLVAISGNTHGDEGLSGLDLAGAAAEQLALCLSNLQLQESLRAQSIRDPLTGLFNRRYMEEALAREIERCRRESKPLALAICDLDHFKQVNDRYGHEGGDALLRAFARLLQDCARRRDIVCRFGGEEFVLILPDTDLATSLRRLEHLRLAVRTLRVQQHGLELAPATASFGLAALEPGVAGGEDLLRAADAALYRAKAAGRNRVMLAGERETDGPAG